MNADIIILVRQGLHCYKGRAKAVKVCVAHPPASTEITEKWVADDLIWVGTAYS